jgi:outer membrane protein assembly factor BamE (lipoprotein component of BamABCDE complex)
MAARYWLAVWVMGVALAIAACDPQRVAKLEEGVSTEEDVRRQFGEPATVTIAADGVRTLEYPRQPEGWTNYRIQIGRDGKMSSLRQLLNEDNFARIKPGMEPREVREMLGRPASQQHFALKNQEVWSWRYKPVNESRLFTVTFGGDGRVAATAQADDPREQAQAGR